MSGGEVNRVERGGLAWLEAGTFAAAGVPHAFGTRRGSAREVQAALGLGGRPLVSVRQVHGDRLVVVHEPGEAKAAARTEADGLLTASPGVALVVWTADCLPILFFDPRQEAVAAVHSGWRGTALRIAGRAVRRMAEEFGSAPGDLLVALGPSIGPCCYEVDAPVLTRLAAAYPGAMGTFLTPASEARALLDLRAAVQWDLKETGVPAENVTVVDECTACQGEWFFSYRRDGPGGGRLAALIGLREGTGCREGKGCREETGAAGRR